MSRRSIAFSGTCLSGPETANFSTSGRSDNSELGSARRTRANAGSSAIGGSTAQ